MKLDGKFYRHRDTRVRKNSIESNETTCAPMNNLTVLQKLNLAIDMTASLAQIHGFSGDAIVHGDVHQSQWLRTRQGHARLNDFNAAEILDWNP